MFAVVCNFSGDIYSRHQSQEAAKKAARKKRKQLKPIGDMSTYVDVVEFPARYTSLIYDKREGPVETGFKRWVSYLD